MTLTASESAEDGSRRFAQVSDKFVIEHGPGSEIEQPGELGACSLGGSAGCRAAEQLRDDAAEHCPGFFGRRSRCPADRRDRSTKTPLLVRQSPHRGGPRGSPALSASDDLLVDAAVDRRRRFGQGMTRRHRAGVSPLVVMQNRTAAGESPHDRQAGQSRRSFAAASAA